MADFLLALDQGTTSSRAVLFDKNASPVFFEQKEFSQIFPQSGWVEHNPEEIWESQLAVARAVFKNLDPVADRIIGIGITNQRETTIVWEKSTGRPIYNAIVWQDRRTAPICEDLKKMGLEEYVRENTGLVIDAYFSGTKIKWLLDNVEGARAKAAAGELLFGTVDSWLLWKLTGGKIHATDVSNASRTLLYNIKKLEWDENLCRALDIPLAMLPEVKSNSELFGYTDEVFFGKKIPIGGMAGDQQSALFGQLCTRPGMAKNTYGTGCFMLMNTGENPITSNSGLLTTIAWKLNGKVTYALEGSVFIAGAAVQWLRDEMKMFETAADAEKLARSVEDAGGVYMVPAFSGLGAPHWDMYARGAIFGITRGTSQAHLVRATLESVAYQTKDVLDAMIKDSGVHLSALRVDGGASGNDFLMQFQADMLNVPVERPSNIETTALGAALLAGLSTGFWTPADLENLYVREKTFVPEMPAEQRKRLYAGWLDAVKRTMSNQINEQP